jgi:hypothetical protein
MRGPSRADFAEGCVLTPSPTTSHRDLPTPRAERRIVRRPSRVQVEAAVAERNREGPLKGKLLCADISGGAEPVGLVGFGWLVGFG